MKSTLQNVLRSEAVTLLSLVAAGVSFLFIPSGTPWWEGIDVRTLVLLFCLMAVMAGFKVSGLFKVLAGRLLPEQCSFRRAAHSLVQLTFFLSMLITNDVALIAFVPFALAVLRALGWQRHAAAVVVLQALAANLGSMATPMGNPQNLFLYTAYALSAADFFATVLPVTLFGEVLLLLCTHLLGNASPEGTLARHEPLASPRLTLLCGGLFVLCLLTLFRCFPVWGLLAIVVLAAGLFARQLLRGVDYGLLLTFVCFFIFSTNIGHAEGVREALVSLLQEHTQSTAILASQVISNVPAAILLAPFTTDLHALLLGVNIGGFGTPIASLASLIALKALFREAEVQPLRSLLLFLALNALFLAALTAFSVCL